MISLDEIERTPNYHARECECDACHALPRCAACHAKIADADDVVKAEDGRTYCDWHVPEAEHRCSACDEVLCCRQHECGGPKDCMCGDEVTP